MVNGRRRVFPFTIYYSLFTIHPSSLAVLGRVEAEDLQPLAGARVDGAEVLAPLHLPDGRDLPVLLDGVVGDLLGRRGLCLLGLSLRGLGLLCLLCLRLLRRGGPA